MRQLLYTGPGQLQWADVPEPDLQGPGEALVRPIVVATCDLDGPLVAGQTPIPAPVALGHEGVGEVVATGQSVTTVHAGDRVIIPFQISCGTCDRCRRGLTGNCESVPQRSMYGFGDFGAGWGGMLTDLVRVPYADAMLVRLPDAMEPAIVASASDNLADAWRTVAPQLRQRPGADVLILGGGARSIALYAVGIARAAGARRITYFDTDPSRLGTARDLGAETIASEPPERAQDSYPIVVDGGSTRASLACACRSTEPGGYCTHVGILYEPETPIPLLEMFAKGVNFHVGRAMARPAIEPLLALVTSGRLSPQRVTDAVLPWNEAAEALLRPHTKLVFARR